MSVDTFDHVVNRKHTSCLKYDFGLQRTGRTDLLPMWVADMDFPLPDEILDPIRRRVDHGIFGYTDPDDSYYEALQGWFLRRYGWKPDKSWNTVTPGIVYAISLAIRAFTRPGEGVLLQEPVYYPFREMIEQNERICVNSPLLLQEDGRYTIDFHDLEEKMKQNHARLFLLCSPHNPVGRVWTEEELVKIAELCRKHQVILLADEIHCDFIFKGSRFVSCGTLDKKYLENLVICTSPSKTFNIAGLQIANILIPNRELRETFRKQNAATGYSQCNAIGLEAAKAAFLYGDAWLDALLEYLQGNLEYFRNYLNQYLPDLKLIEPEGTYLLWVDFSRVASSPQDLQRMIRDRAKLWLDDGAVFGEDSAFFERFNIACPRSVLQQALDQLRQAFTS